MNELKRRTSKEYRAWDLDVPQYVNIRNRRKLEVILKRKARRVMKQELLPEIHEAWELLDS
jgi:hypothetical protein